MILAFSSVILQPGNLEGFFVTQVPMWNASSDIICFPVAPSPREARQGAWLVMNVFTKNCIALETDGLQLLSGVLENEETAPQSFKIWQVGFFSHLKGLLEDPSRFIREVTDWPPPEELSYSDAICLLKESCLIVENEGTYRKRFAPKKNLLDKHNFGNLHQQLGQQLFFAEHQDPEEWWVKQKFKSDRQSLRSNLYAAVQGEYLGDYFKGKLQEGDRVLDLGCGTGFYANQMADAGAMVVGVDPNQKYIPLAV